MHRLGWAGIALAALAIFGCAGSASLVPEAGTTGTGATTTSTGATGGTQGSGTTAVFLPGGADPGGMALDTSGGRLFFASAVRNRIDVLDSNTGEHLGSTSIHGGPIRAAYSRTLDQVLVAMLDKGTIETFSPTFQAIASYSVGVQPRSVVVDDARSRVYVALFGEDAVVAYDLATMEPQWRAIVGRGPRFLALNSVTGELLCGCALDGAVVLLGTDGLTKAQRFLGLAPTSGVYDSVDGCFLATDYAAGTLVRLHGLSLETLSVNDTGFGASGIGFDRSSSSVLVGSALLNGFSIVRGSSTSLFEADVKVQGFASSSSAGSVYAADYINGFVYRVDLGSHHIEGPLNP